MKKNSIINALIVLSLFSAQNITPKASIDCKKPFLGCGLFSGKKCVKCPNNVDCKHKCIKKEKLTSCLKNKILTILAPAIGASEAALAVVCLVAPFVVFVMGGEELAPAVIAAGWPTCFFLYNIPAVLGGTLLTALINGLPDCF